MHEMKRGGGARRLFHARHRARGDTDKCFDTEPQSCGEKLPVEPPDAAGFYKYVFKISGRQRFTLAYFKRRKTKRVRKRSHRNSAPSGGGMHARKRAQITLLLQFSLPNQPSLSLPAATSLDNETQIRSSRPHRSFPALESFGPRLRLFPWMCSFSITGGNDVRLV